MMRILVAPDSFKESIEAPKAAVLIEKGIRCVYSDAVVYKMPVSDGGEGMTRSLVDATGGRLINKTVTGPLGQEVNGFYGILGDGVTAVVEMAAASGLPLVPINHRNPLVTTTYGTGELIKAAIEEGVTRIIVGIGGSATNDGGAGMAQALGAKLLDGSGEEIGRGAQGLYELSKIDNTALEQRLLGISITAACDVDNPLCGPWGASAVYGPQKGATPEMIPMLDGALRHFAHIIKEDLGKDVDGLPGAGAAGGMGAGLVAFCGAMLRRGTEIVLDTLQLEEKIARGVDLVITGEGEINNQTIYGKAPIGVAALAKKHGVPVLAVVGSIGADSGIVYEHGIDALMTIVPRPMVLQQAMSEAEELLVEAVARAMRLIKIGAITGKGGEGR